MVNLTLIPSQSSENCRHTLFQSLWWIPFWPQLCLDILSMNIKKRRRMKPQPCCNSAHREQAWCLKSRNNSCNPHCTTGMSAVLWPGKKMCIFPAEICVWQSVRPSIPTSFHSSILTRPSWKGWLGYPNAWHEPSDPLYLYKMFWSSRGTVHVLKQCLSSKAL